MILDAWCFHLLQLSGGFLRQFTIYVVEGKRNERYRYSWLTTTRKTKKGFTSLHGEKRRDKTSKCIKLAGQRSAREASIDDPLAKPLPNLVLGRSDEKNKKKRKKVRNIQNALLGMSFHLKSRMTC